MNGNPASKSGRPPENGPASPQSVERGLEHGGVIPGTRKAAYTLSVPGDMPIPVLIAVPHAGRDYPDALVRKMREADYSMLRLEDRYVDRIAALVAGHTGAALLTAHAPRAMLDLNRAIDDVDWDMISDAVPEGGRHSVANRRARSGLGLIPRRLPGLGEIWNARMTDAELSARIRQIHTPYHGALSKALERLRHRWGATLLIDLHSMPPLKKAHRDDVTAHFVLGDRFGASANDRLVAGALQHLAEQGVGIAHNRPYAGGYVLDRHAAPARSIHAVQLEICRSLYLDPAMADTTDGLTGVADQIAGLVRIMGEGIARLGRSSGLPMAAE